MGWFSNLIRAPFSFFGAGSSKEERLAAYVLREHARGRPLTEILEDPYLRNRSTPRERDRLLDRPEIIHALGEDVVAFVRAEMPQS
ncbi:MAG TPA: hypothetical protein VF895_10955 [Gaiellaceae bacterium]